MQLFIHTYFDKPTLFISYLFPLQVSVLMSYDFQIIGLYIKHSVNAPCEAKNIAPFLKREMIVIYLSLGYFIMREYWKNKWLIIESNHESVPKEM